MRVQYTLPDAVADAIRQRAKSLGIHPSRLVEEYLTAGLRSSAALTLTPQSHVPPSGVTEQYPLSTREAGSKRTTSQDLSADPLLAEMFEPEMAPADDLPDATDHARPLHR